MSNKELVDLIHRLGKDAKLTELAKDGTLMVYADFWQAFGELMKAIGVKAKCPYYREEQEHE